MRVYLKFSMNCVMEDNTLHITFSFGNRQPYNSMSDIEFVINVSIVVGSESLETC